MVVYTVLKGQENCLERYLIDLVGVYSTKDRAIEALIVDAKSYFGGEYEEVLDARMPSYIETSYESKNEIFDFNVTSLNYFNGEDNYYDIYIEKTVVDN